MIIVFAIGAKRQLYISWMKTKLEYNDLDNIYNTGQLKKMIIECLFMLVMPYPCLYGKTYMETADDWTVGIEFSWNDWLLCFCMFSRVHFFIITLLNNTTYM